ncbi:MAG: hypothetical protein LBS12_04230 [Prevotellaceae bacterium]|nr:hypothetical protein [Prevotellaceae bacterium]
MALQAVPSGATACLSYAGAMPSHMSSVALPRSKEASAMTEYAGKSAKDKKSTYRMKFIRYGIGFIPYGIGFIRYGMNFIRYGMNFIRYGMNFIRYGMNFIRYVDFF